MSEAEIKLPMSDTGRSTCPTPMIRWHHHNVHDSAGRLQQAHQDLRTGEIEWRDVEHFFENPK